jgi:hypothetical protein
MAGRARTGRRLVAVTMAVLVLAGCTKDRALTVGLYDVAPVPAVPDHTAAVLEPLADGDYWAPSVAVEGDQLVFTIQQAFFGPGCAQELGAEACVDEPGVRDQPATSLSVTSADLGSVTVVTADRKNYAVTGTELATLVSGGHPSAKAPPTFAFAPYPYLVTVRDGAIELVHQVWVP